jgi:hypothetical protein
VNFDFLYDALFWAAGLCAIFWMGLLIAGLAGQSMGDESPMLVHKEHGVSARRSSMRS